MTEYEQLLSNLGEVDYHTFLKYLSHLESRGFITLYAGTYSINTAVKMQDIEQAEFYFYYNENKAGFCFYINVMGASLKEDQNLFSFTLRRLYSKNRLSNCFFGEVDLRSGEFFAKRNRAPLNLRNIFSRK